MLDSELRPERMLRVSAGARQWLDDLRQQHFAQEEFLRGLAAALWPELGRALQWPSPPNHEIARRWHQPTCWSPVSSYLEFWLWDAHRLEGWAHPHFWTEICLRAGDLSIRSGLRLDGRAVVGRWFAPIREVAEKTFRERYSEYHKRASYAEVWAWYPFQAERQHEVRDRVVHDLVTWATEVLPALNQK